MKITAYPLPKNLTEAILVLLLDLDPKELEIIKEHGPSIIFL